MGSSDLTWKERIKRFFSALIPVHGKRIFFVTTLYMQLVSLFSLKDDRRAELMKMLNIATDARALELPGLLHQHIWSNTPLCEVLENGELHGKFCKSDSAHACEKIVDMVPCLMRYGRREDMVRDVCRLFELCGLKEASTDVPNTAATA